MPSYIMCIIKFNTTIKYKPVQTNQPALSQICLVTVVDHFTGPVQMEFIRNGYLVPIFFFLIMHGDGYRPKVFKNHGMLARDDLWWSASNIPHIPDSCKMR
jgi:hypothetical protein